MIGYFRKSTKKDVEKTDEATEEAVQEPEVRRLSLAKTKQLTFNT